MTIDKTLPMRLAMRQEGDKWNAYVAKPDTMEGAIWIGSIALRFIEDDPKREKAFLALMRDAVGDIIRDITGHKPTWSETRAAPEHERTKG